MLPDHQLRFVTMGLLGLPVEKATALPVIPFPNLKFDPAARDNFPPGLVPPHGPENVRPPDKLV